MEPAYDFRTGANLPSWMLTLTAFPDAGASATPTGAPAGVAVSRRQSPGNSAGAAAPRIDDLQDETHVGEPATDGGLHRINGSPQALKDGSVAPTGPRYQLTETGYSPLGQDQTFSTTVGSLASANFPIEFGLADLFVAKNRAGSKSLQYGISEASPNAFRASVNDQGVFEFNFPMNRQFSADMPELSYAKGDMAYVMTDRGPVYFRFQPQGDRDAVRSQLLSGALERFERDGVPMQAFKYVVEHGEGDYASLHALPTAPSALATSVGNVAAQHGFTQATVNLDTPDGSVEVIFSKRDAQ
jgi:hypothetical protein